MATYNNFSSNNDIVSMMHVNKSQKINIIIILVIVLLWTMEMKNAFNEKEGTN